MIGWFTKPNLDMASYRYRCMIPMRELRKLGAKVEIGFGNTMVFGKHFDTKDADVAASLKQQGGRVVFDVCDDYFGRQFDAHYRAMIDLADVVTCPTETMADRILTETGKGAVVIADPYELPEYPPAMRKDGELRVLWYGHHTNQPSLIAEAPSLKGYELLVVSDVKIEGAPYMPWSRDAMRHALSWCDVVIIPVENVPQNRCKSPNRMVEAIRSGKYVVANPMPAYEPYGMWQGDIGEGLRWVSENREAAMDAVRIAQLLVREINAPALIGRQWLDALEGSDLRTPEEMQAEIGAAA